MISIKKSIVDLQILLIDDNQQAVRLLSMMLRDMGVKNILTASNGQNGQEIIDATDKGAIDVIVCDWNMPGLTGIELLRYLRGRGDHTPFIMITGKDTVESTIEAAKAGVTFYLPKPFGPDKLEQKVLLATGLLSFEDEEPRMV
ncbi:MAG: response regulator receiver [Rhodospirillaceae bacterium]|nr:MAG: response regulator receiver [Rhodospirillaceae bacterium]